MLRDKVPNSLSRCHTRPSFFFFWYDTDFLDFFFLISIENYFSMQVAKVLMALQAGSRGTQACINAASTVSGIIGDLDTTIMFATAGTLNAEGDEAFSDHR